METRNLRYVAYLFLAGLISMHAVATAHADAGAPQVSASAQNIVHAQGVVRDVDKDSNRIVIACDPVPALMWPQMTVAFPVRDKAMLVAVAPGVRAEFDIRPQGDEFVIERITASMSHGTQK